ncbi:hypothetical protein [Streptomyces sp. NPDC058475]
MFKSDADTAEGMFKSDAGPAEAQSAGPASVAFCTTSMCAERVTARLPGADGYLAR